MRAERHLLIDLGGTNTRVALGDDNGVLMESAVRYANHAFTGLSDVVHAFLKDHSVDIVGLCGGVAGPVQHGTAQLTNHDWFIDGAALQDQTGARHVALINDLQAQGYALDDVPDAALRRIKEGRAADGPRLVFNIGTGCNGAVVHKGDGRLFVPAAEAGHSALPHADGDLRDLFDHLRKTHAHLPVEVVLSGPGLSRVHAWVTSDTLSPEAVLDLIATGQKTGEKSLALFLRALGSVLGNFALHHLPKGGIYLSGGLAEAMAPYLNNPLFLDPLIDRGPYTHIVDAMPIFVIAENGFALRGCHRYLRQSLK